MTKPSIRMAVAAGCVCLSLIPVSSACAQVYGTGAFSNVASIEKQLLRGRSTKSDVQRLLGVPSGAGSADMVRPAIVDVPPLGEGPREIWFYDDLEITDVKSRGGVATMNIRQQILLVFFKGDLFDGHLWTTNVVKPTAD
mgnify:CR=1 FL=1